MLEWLIKIWDPDGKHFMVRDQVLKLDIEDIYFLTRLSWHGSTMVLVGSKEGSGEPIDAYIR